MKYNFDDIRAYPRRVFRRYWKQIANDPHVQDMLSRMESMPDAVKKNISRIRNWRQFRKAMIYMVDLVISKTSQGLSYSGTEKLSPRGTKGAIFISNHRSTSLDPILFNYVLYRATGDTAYNAAGDNLMATSWLGHIIRLNRGFIVKRTVEDPEQKIFEAEKLSQYIRSLLEKGKNVWIAQRNGRAKDGVDKTDSAVLAMLKLAHPEKNWEEFSAAVPIYPVSMSYEEIPLDTTIAKDHLGMLDRSDSGRDSGQVVTEIGQQKRRIHVHFSEPVRGSKRGELVKNLDKAILHGVKIWESNRLAASILQGSQDRAMEAQLAWFTEKLSDSTSAIREVLLQMYAAPVLGQAAT